MKCELCNQPVTNNVGAKTYHMKCLMEDMRKTRETFQKMVDNLKYNQDRKKTQ